MANKVDNTITNFGKAIVNKPILSGLSTIFGLAAIGASTAINNELAADILFFGLAASPVATGALFVTAAASAFRDRSKLSKAFSIAAAGTAAAGLVAFGTQISEPGLSSLGAFFYSLVSMTAAGGLNLFAHYTKDKHLSVSASVKLEKADKPADQEGPKPPTSP